MWFHLIQFQQHDEISGIAAQVTEGIKWEINLKNIYWVHIKENFEYHTKEIRLFFSVECSVTASIQWLHLFL